MGDSYWRRFRIVFDEVIGQSTPTGQMRRLEELHPTPTIRNHVAGMLGNYRQTDPVFDWAAKNAAQAPLFQEGQVLVSRFRVVRFLGRGGMGEVYEAEDATLRNRPVALKTLTAEIRQTPEASHRFLREVELAQRVTHPNICRIHDIYHHPVHDPVTGVEQQTEFLAMQLLRGETLSEYMAKHERLPLNEALRLLRQLADALEAAHSAGVIHRDFKPGNVILVEHLGQLHPVITDFGLALLIDRPPEGEGDSRFATYTRAGTPDYAPPEQISGGRITASADVFALGVVALEMLTGQTSDGSAKGLTATQRGAFERCLRKEPSERFSTPSEFVRALAGDQPASVESNRIVTRRGFVGVAAGAAATGGLIFTFRKSLFRGFQISKLAILPFQGDAGNMAMPGFHEELVRVFSKSKKVRLVAPYAFAPRTPILDAQRISNLLLLPADGFLTGVISSADVLIQLMAKGGAVLWHRKFSRSQPDYKLHHDIEYAVLSEIDGDEANAFLESSNEPTPEGYRAYVNGRSVLSGHSEAELNQAEGLFREAISHDADYAPAWAGLAYASFLTSRLDEARSAADHALKLDDQCAEAYLTKGLVLQRGDWKWNEAEIAFKQALAREPFNGRAHQCYGGLLSNLGRHSEAIPELKSAVDFDPVSANPLVLLGIGLLFAKQVDAAIDNLTRAIPMANKSWTSAARPFLGACWVMKGDREKAYQLYAQAAEAEPDGIITLSHFVYGAAKCGRLPKAQQALERLLHLDGAKDSPFWVAVAVSAIGDRDRAFEQLRRAVEHRDPEVVLLKTHIYLDALRTDSRYPALLNQLGLA